jgi:hypothetical protein
MAEPLFAGYEPPPAPPGPDSDLSAGQRLTLRQANDIAVARHPLTRGRLHPDADPTATKDSPAGRPHTCGTCVHRELRLHNNGTYPKCVAHGGKFVTRGATTDVRAWWPACPDYQEVSR